MIAAVASENGAPYGSATRAPSSSSSSSVSWQRFSTGDGRGTYELVTRCRSPSSSSSSATSPSDGSETSSAAEVSLVRNGHRVKVSGSTSILQSNTALHTNDTIYSVSSFLHLDDFYDVIAIIEGIPRLRREPRPADVLDALPLLPGPGERPPRQPGQPRCSTICPDWSKWASVPDMAFNLTFIQIILEFFNKIKVSCQGIREYLCICLNTGTAFAAGSPAASGRLDLGPSVLATCVLEKETLRVFYDNGDDFPVSLPFPVKRYGAVLSTIAYWRDRH